MSDYNSELPVRSSLPGQVLPDDVIIKIGDATNPTTQMASVDTHGSLQTKIADASGDVISSQNLESSYWLQVVGPANGPSAPGTASSYANLMAGMYNSTQPSLSNGQQSALQLTSVGALIVSPSQDTIPATQSITAQDTGSSSNTEANGQIFVTGSPTADSAASFAISTQESIKIEVTGTWTGTLAVEQSIDSGTTWTASNVHQIGTAYNTNNFTGNFIGGVNVAGATNIRIRSTAAWTGSATVAIVESTNIFSLYVVNPIKLVDSTTNVESSIILGSAAASASNNALVVALAPNSPLPAGSNNIGFTNSNLYVSSAPVTVSNPVPVTITSASAGTPIQNFQTSAALAAGSNVSLTYTVPATHTFSLERIFASSEARMKITITINSVESYVAFTTSAMPNLDLTVTAPPSLTAGETVVVNFKNIDTGASDVYVTIEGNQIS